MRYEEEREEGEGMGAYMKRSTYGRGLFIVYIQCGQEKTGIRGSHSTSPPEGTNVTFLFICYFEHYVSN